MIVREMYSSEALDSDNQLPYLFAVVSVAEKRQQTVAEVVRALCQCSGRATRGLFDTPAFPT